MKILVLNCGSSSIKYKLYDMDKKAEMTSGGIEKIGLPDSFLKFKCPNGEKKVIEQSIPEHTSGVELILSVLVDENDGAIKALEEIEAVGHRVVHAGEKYASSVVITDDVVAALEECTDLAPLHNPANLKGIYAVKKILPNVPQVGVFDTAFHQTMPEHAYMYALPKRYYDQYGVRKYGFHGTSHRYVSKRGCEFLGLDYNNSKIITAHIGNGGSITAIKDGKSIETSMGMTPVEGLMMGTRSGNVDLGVITYIIDKENLSSKDVSNIINKQSGLFGVSGVSSDMRDIEAAIAEGNKDAKLALDMYMYVVLKYISCYVGILGGADAIIFTGGVGENMPLIREYIADSLKFLGVEFDSELNAKSRGREVELTKAGSKIRIAVIPTDEEFAIAMDTQALV